MALDWTKPLRFKRVQDSDHVTYQPRYVGPYANDKGFIQHVVVARHWDNAISFIAYDEFGHVIDPAAAEGAIKATGIFDPNLENGPEITCHEATINGARVRVTFDGDTPVKVKLA